jgi:Bacterial extracellular solute-binding proteins, family 5 Middle
MKLRVFLFLAATSLLAFSATRLESARRPKYGGTLRIDASAVVTSLDSGLPPANPEEAALRDEIGFLIYERRNPDGTFAGVAGSGAFRIAEWEPGKHAMLAANDSFRRGRAFLDYVEIQMGRSAHDRLLDLELDKADVAEIPAGEAHQAADRGVRLAISQPDELLALALDAHSPLASDANAREALSLAIDRAAIVNFILQRTGEPAGGLLPQWSSGTAFLFSTAADVSAAKNLWAQSSGSPKIALGYDANDMLEQAIAERIAVNVREAGIPLSLQAAAGGSPAQDDARLIRLSMPSPNPRDALSHFCALLGPATGLNCDALPGEASAQQVYDRERAIVSSYRVIPLVWVPRVYGLSVRVKNWKTPATGDHWPLADVWLGDSQ